MTVDHDGDRREVAAPTSGAPSLRDRRWVFVAVGVLAVQVVALVLWQTIRFDHFAGSQDEATVFQAMYEIAHGNLNPYSQTVGFTWLRNHGAVIMWLFAPLDRLGPPGLALLWLQAVAVAATEFVALLWISRVLASASSLALPVRRARIIFALALAIIVVEPWSYWSVGNDVHIEIFAAPFILAAAMDFSTGHLRRGWVWVAITLGFGDVSSTWLVGLALSAVVAGVVDRDVLRSRLTMAVALSAIGVGWSGVVSVMGYARGSTFTRNFAYLTVPLGHALPHHIGFTRLVRAAFKHPMRFVKEVGYHWRNVYANLAPWGFIGVATAWTLGVPAVILVENTLTSGTKFNEPSFQSFPVYGFVLVGTVSLLVALVTRARGRVLFAAAVAVLGLNAAGWALVFLPNLASVWMPVTGSQAAFLSATLSGIPASAPVAVSPEIAARFANRREVYMLNADLGISHLVTPLWIIDAPGIATTYGAPDSPAILDDLLQSPGVTELTSSQGIYVFRWTPSDASSVFTLAGPRFALPLNVDVGPAGRAQRVGASPGWSVVATGARGDVVRVRLSPVPLGTYDLSVRLSNAGPVRLDAGDSSTSLGDVSRSIASHAGARDVSVTVDVTVAAAATRPFSGWGPFFDRAPAAAPRGALWLRIGDPLGAPVIVEHIDVRHMSS